MEILKKLRASATLAAVLAILTGILFCIKPIGTSAAVMVIAGTMLLISAVSDIFGYIKARHVVGYENSLMTGVVKAVLGIFALTHTGTMLTLFSYIFSILVITDGVKNIEHAIRLHQMQAPGWALSLVLSVLLTLCGIGMLFDPVDAISTASLWIGLALIFDGVVNLVTLEKLKRAGMTVRNAFMNK
ncbi:MAG: DUF308 domain-containing protein [Clostridia bacterium]|nr:DUF308 domain-containing protein [Clostridia bacterium]